MSDDCRHWTTPRWLQTIYERFCTPFLAWVALAADGTTPAALNLTADGKLKVQMDGGSGGGGLVTLDGVSAGVTLPVSGDFYPPVQSVSLVGDSLSSIPVSLTAAVSLAGGQSLTSARSWNLAAGTDTITASIASIPTISGSVSVNNFPSIQNVSLVGDSLASIPVSLTAATSLSAGQSLTADRSWNLATSTDSLTAAVSSLPAVSLAGSQTLTAALTSGSTLASSGNSTLSSVASGVTLPVSGSFYQATQPVSGNLGRTWNLAQGTDTLYASLGSQSLAVTGNFYQATQPVQASGGDLTSGNQKTQIVNGSNTLAIDSLGALTANNPLSIQQSYTFTGAILFNTVVIGPVDCSNFRTVCVQMTSFGSGWQGTCEVSNDGNNWSQVVVLVFGGSTYSYGAIGSSGAPTGMYFASVQGAKYFRIRTSVAGTSGTTTIVCQFSQLPTSSNQFQNVSILGVPNTNAFHPVSATTTAGGSVSTLAGGSTVLGGSSATKSLTIQNNNLSGNIYFNVGATNTSTLPQAQCVLLTAGQGYTFDVLPSSTQYLFLQSPTSGLTYSLLYA